MGVEHRARESAPARYRPRRSSRSVLYHCVQERLETWLAQCREGHDDDGPVPEYVEREFRRYLECGLLAYGFARARCGQCRHDFLIACSCAAACCRAMTHARWGNGRMVAGFGYGRCA
jgi:Transposase zinc-binding domain